MDCYGKHLTLMISDVENIDVINSEKAIKEFLNELVQRIKMRILVPPIVGFEDGGFENVGYSGVVILYESHAAIHVYSGLRKAFIDVFSCKAYDEKEIAAYIAEKVGNYKIEEYAVADRGRHWGKDIAEEMKRWEKTRERAGESNGR